MLVEAACGAQPGSVTLKINSANPTVSTASTAFVSAADGAGGWEGQVWDQDVTVPCTTLDELIANTVRQRSPRSTWKASRTRCWRVFHLAACGPFPSSSPRDPARRGVPLPRSVSLAPAPWLRPGAGREPGLSFGRWISGPEMAAHIARLPHEAIPVTCTVSCNSSRARRPSPSPRLRGEDRVRGSDKSDAGAGRSPHPNPLPTEEWGEGIRAALAAAVCSLRLVAADPGAGRVIRARLPWR